MGLMSLNASLECRGENLGLDAHHQREIQIASSEAFRAFPLSPDPRSFHTNSFYGIL